LSKKQQPGDDGVVWRMQDLMDIILEAQRASKLKQKSGNNFSSEVTSNHSPNQ